MAIEFDDEETKPGVPVIEGVPEVQAHEHKYTSTIDVRDDPPKRKVCEICAHTEPIP
jgi:hypothetical protein